MSNLLSLSSSSDIETGTETVPDPGIDTAASTTTAVPLRARTGKIARLPRHLRARVNQRLADGEAAPRLLEWLNAQPAAWEVLANKFDSRPVTPQNLSEWRQGGFQDWLQQEEDLALAQTLLDEAGAFTTATAAAGTTASASASACDPDPDPDDREISPAGLPLADRLSAMAALAVAKIIRTVSRDSLDSPQSKKSSSKPSKLSTACAAATTTPSA